MTMLWNTPKQIEREEQRDEVGNGEGEAEADEEVMEDPSVVGVDGLR